MPCWRKGIPFTLTDVQALDALRTGIWQEAEYLGISGRLPWRLFR